jgi:hypothetical protein
MHPTHARAQRAGQRLTAAYALAATYALTAAYALAATYALTAAYAPPVDYVFVLILSNTTGMQGGELQVLQLGDASGKFFDEIKVL